MSWSAVIMYIRDRAWVFDNAIHLTTGQYSNEVVSMIKNILIRNLVRAIFNSWFHVKTISRRGNYKQTRLVCLVLFAHAGFVLRFGHENRSKYSKLHFRGNKMFQHSPFCNNSDVDVCLLIIQFGYR